MKKITLLFALVFAGFFISAQNLNFNVCGYVSSTDPNTPANNAQIGGYITQGNGTTLGQFSTYTDSTGYFCTQYYSVAPDTGGCAYLSINITATISECNSTQTYTFSEWLCTDTNIYVNISGCDTSGTNTCNAYIADSTGFFGTLSAWGNGTSPFTYQWFFNNQQISTNQSISPTAYGQYCVYVTDANGCVASDCYNYGNNNNTCSVTIYQYTDTATGVDYLYADYSGNGNPVSYTWQWNGVAPQDTNPALASASGTYCVVVSDDSGCTANACYYYGQNNNQCSVLFSSYEDSSNLGTVYFYPYSSGTPPFIYNWSFSDGTTDTSEYPVHTFIYSNGWDYACVEITDANGCMSSYCDYVYVGGGGNVINCSASFSGYFDDYNGNAGEIFFLDYSYSNNNIVSWAWDFGDGSSSTMQNPSHVYSSTGNYTICLTITDAGGCSSNYCETWYVDTAWWGVNPWNGNGTTCNAQFIAMQDSTVPGMVYLVDLSYGNNLFYTWTFVSDDGTINQTINTQYPFINFNQFGCFSVCLTVTDTLGNCQDSYCDSVCVDSLGNLNKATNWGLAVISSAMPNSLFVSAKEEMQSNNSISIYPNPTSGEFTVIANGEKQSALKIYNLLGEVVFQSTIRNSKLAIDISHFPNGVYFAKISSDGVSYSEKIVKLK